MAKLSLTLACGDYDRTRALWDGTVSPEGIDLNYIALPVEEIFWRMVRHREFDASEMSLSSYLMQQARGDTSFIAIPVFPSRQFRHNAIFVHVGAGIQRPQDLAGKRVGLPEYQMTAVVWVKGILQHDYGVPPEQIRWFVGGQEIPGREERVPFPFPRGLHIEPIPPQETLNDMLERGDLDAFIGSRMPSCFLRGSSQVRRLFQDFRTVEQDYYRRTGIFPIMHTVVLRRELYQAHPWVARSLYKAFSQAKELCQEAMYSTSVLRYSLPWLVAEIEEAKELFGADWWPYGVEPNRHTVATLIQYAQEQGLIDRPLALDDLFAPTTFDEFKV